MADATTYYGPFDLSAPLDCEWAAQACAIPGWELAQCWPPEGDELGHYFCIGEPLHPVQPEPEPPRKSSGAVWALALVGIALAGTMVYVAKG